MAKSISPPPSPPHEVYLQNEAFSRVITRRDSYTYERNKFTNKIVTFMSYSNDMFRYMFKAEYVTLLSLRVS